MYRPRLATYFRWRVSAGFSAKEKKCISACARGNAPAEPRNLPLVTRHFYRLHKFRVVNMRVALVWARREPKSRSWSGLSGRGNARIERRPNAASINFCASTKLD